MPFASHCHDHLRLVLVLPCVVSAAAAAAAITTCPASAPAAGTRAAAPASAAIPAGPVLCCRARAVGSCGGCSGPIRLPLRAVGRLALLPGRLLLSWALLWPLACCLLSRLLAVLGWALNAQRSPRRRHQGLR